MSLPRACACRVLMLAFFEKLLEDNRLLISFFLENNWHFSRRLSAEWCNDLENET